MKITTLTLKQYILNGLLRFYKVAGEILYKESDIENYLERNGIFEVDIISPILTLEKLMTVEKENPIGKNTLVGYVKCL